MGPLGVIALVLASALVAGVSCATTTEKGTEELFSVVQRVYTLCNTITVPDLVRGLQIGYSSKLDAYKYFTGSSAEDRRWRKCQDPLHGFEPIILG
jgi:nucleoid-associated protein YejK